MYLGGILILIVGFLASIVFACSPKKRKVGVCFLVAVVGFVTARLVVESQWRKKFASLPDGISERALKDSLWWSTFEFEGGKSPWGYSLGQSEPSVRKEIWCVAFFLPEQYAFGLDSTGKLVARFHFVSP